MKNWKTTAMGILAILGAVVNFATGWLAGTPVDFTATVAAISAGIGLILASDAKPAA